MRRLIIIISAVCFLLLLTTIFFRPGVVILVKKQLQNVFIKSQVSIGRCVFRPASGLKLYDLEIKRQNIYDIKVKEVAIKPNLFLLLRPGFLKLSLIGPSIYLNTPKRPIREFSGYLNIGRGSPVFNSVEISDMGLDLNTLDLTAKATLTSRLNLIKQSLDYLNLKINSFSMQGVQLENVWLEFGPSSAEGKFSASLLKYDKLSVTDIKGNIKLQDEVVFVYGVSAMALNGSMHLNSEIDKAGRYVVDLKCSDFDLAKFIRDFNLREKFDMTGRLSGGLKLKGKAAQVEVMEGNFLSAPPGGTLVITDAKFLESMALTTGQPASLLVESFKDYRYNTGVMSLGLDGGNIILKINLEGDAGKRQLNVILHNLKPGRRGQQ